MKKDLRDEVALVILSGLMRKNGYVISSIWFRLSKFLGFNFIAKKGERKIYWNYDNIAKTAYEFADIFLQYKNKTE